MKLTEFQKLSHKHYNDSLLYRLLLPKNYSHESKYPLILFMHGAGERGSDNELQLKYITELFLDEYNRENYPCFVLAPQCPPDPVWWSYTSWSNPVLPKEPSLELSMVISLLDELIQNYPVDESRIYITGLSMGGCATYDLIMRYPAKFATAIPVCGWGDTSKAEVIKEIPVWIFHGDDDAIVSVDYSRKMYNALKIINGNVKYTEYPGIGHDSWIYAYKEPELLKWLFDQTKQLKLRKNK